MGLAVGTPPYMSPEQAAGRHDQLTRASDVYSLGATLFHLLTGEPPLAECTSAEILRRVQRGDIPAPRQVKADVPKGLDAVCRKAMAFAPADRYSSARAMADDLEHWLADEPLTALPDRLADRVFRVARRHRSAAITTTAAAILIAIVATGATLLVSRLARENANLADSRAQALIRAEASARDAEAEAKRANELADKQTLLVQDKEKALKSAKESEEGERAAAKRERAAAKAAKQLADEKTQLASDKSNLAAAEAASRENAETLSQFLVAAIQPEDPTRFTGATFFAPKENAHTFRVFDMLQVGIKRAYDELNGSPLAQAAVLDSLGNACRQLAVFNGAERLLMDALQVRRRELPADDPDLATSCFHMAWYYHERGDFEKARPLYREALSIREKLPDGQSSVAETLHNLGWIYYYDGSLNEMEESFTKAIEIREKLLEKAPADRAALRDAVFTKLGAASAYGGQARLLRAQPLARDTQGRAERSRPNGWLLKAKALAADTALHKNIKQLMGNDKLVKALEYFVKAEDDRVFSGDLLKASKGLNQALELVRQEKRAGEALELFVRAELAEVLVKLDQLREAEKHYQASIDIVRRHQLFQIPRQASMLDAVGQLWWRLGKQTEAEQLWQDYLRAQAFRFGVQHPFYKDAYSAYQEFGRRMRRNRESASLR
jgi:tetratricopeptide (TPR) repeat protein